MRISIITITKDRAAILPRCLESVANQTLTDFEHLIIDGMSSDDTAKVVEEYIEKNPRIKVKFLKAEPRGISNAFNIGIKNATGRYVLFLNDDDYLIDKDSLKRADEVLRKHPEIRWLQGGVAVRFKLPWSNNESQMSFPNKYYLIDRLFYIGASVAGVINHQNTFMDVDVFRVYGMFDESLKTNMDTDLWFRLMGNEKIFFVDTIFSVWSYTGKSESKQLGFWNRMKVVAGLRRKYGIVPVVSGVRMMRERGEMVGRV